MYNYSFPLTAGADHRTHQYKVVNIGGTRAVSAQTAFGIQENKPNSGERLTAVYAGRSKYAAGAAITAGAELTVASGGWVIVAVSGSRVIGVNGEDAVASGAIGPDGIFNFAAKGYKNTT